MSFNRRIALAVCAAALSLGLVLAPGTFAQDKPGTMAKDSMKKDDMNKDKMKKDDAMAKDGMKKTDTMKKDDMKK